MQKNQSMVQQCILFNSLIYFTRLATDWNTSKFDFQETLRASYQSALRYPFIAIVYRRQSTVYPCCCGALVIAIVPTVILLVLLLLAMYAGQV